MILTISQAQEQILSGETVAIPTETVYGLAASLFRPDAIEKTFRLKGRPADNPLIVHISDLMMLDQIAENIPEEVTRLAQHFWPGALTLVLHKKNDVPDIATAGLNTVAVRMPDHPLALQLISATGPLTAPSANRSGKPSPTSAQHVLEDFNHLVPVLDGGLCSIGLESTVLDLSQKPFTILRPGMIGVEELRQVLKCDVIVSHNHPNNHPHNPNVVRLVNETETYSENKDEKHEKHGIDKLRKSPGTRYKHYAPLARVQWANSPIAVSHQTDVMLILHLSETKDPTPGSTFNSVPSNVHVFSFHEEYERLAAQLYELFRRADREGYQTILIEPFPKPITNPICLALKNRIEHAISQDSDLPELLP